MDMLLYFMENSNFVLLTIVLRGFEVFLLVFRLFGVL